MSNGVLLLTEAALPRRLSIAQLHPCRCLSRHYAGRDRAASGYHLVGGNPDRPYTLEPLELQIKGSPLGSVRSFVPGSRLQLLFCFETRIPRQALVMKRGLHFTTTLGLAL